MKVIIAGAGIVGLTLGTALRRVGVDVTVCEQASGIRAVGASIGLWRNALDVLAAAGLATPISALSTTITAWFYDPAGNPFRDAADHTFELLPRPQLTDLLADSVGRASIRLGAKIVGYDEAADAVTVRFADGTHLTADLLIGADGVHSRVREQLVPGFPAHEHLGHHAWRATLPAHDVPHQGSVLTVGHHRTRGGFTRTYGDQVMWMVNQFDSAPPTGTRKAEALARAANLNDGGWQDTLLDLIDATPEDAILHNQIMKVPPLPRWTSERVALIGDAAHALSPHISAGGTLGIEDVGVLVDALHTEPDLKRALTAYETARIPRYATVRAHSQVIEDAVDAQQYATRYAAFVDWMLA